MASIYSRFVYCLVVQFFILKVQQLLFLEDPSKNILAITAALIYMQICMASRNVPAFRGFQFEYLDHCYSNIAITDCSARKLRYIDTFYICTVLYRDTYLLYRYIAISICIADPYCGDLVNALASQKSKNSGVRKW